MRTLPSWRPPVLALLLIGATLTLSPARPAAQAETTGPLQLTADRPIALRSLAAELEDRERSGSLRVTSRGNDGLAPGYQHDRLQQYHLGLRVVGGDLTRQYSGGIVTAIFGNLYRTERNNIDAKLSADEVAGRLRAVPGSQLLRAPRLTWLGAPDGSAALVYEAFVSGASDTRVVYLDADSGEERTAVSLVQTQAAVGEGTGVLGDRKKVSSRGGTAGYRLDDLQRPPTIQTIDLRGNPGRRAQLWQGETVSASDMAVDSDNVWTDGPVVDAHAHLGWVYDFLYKQLGFKGLDNADAPMRALTNLYQPGDCLRSGIDPDDCVNAFWLGPPYGPGGRGAMFFGNGIPLTYYLASSGQTVRPLAGALDIVAHELTHGVTGYTSGLIYRNESGALNESFSDMMGTAVEAYYQPRGPRYQGADYLLGEDVFRAGRAGAHDGIRSLASPSEFGDPDSYGDRQFVGAAALDKGGVHKNSSIANHAYYLAIEGGVHRLSGRSVSGVGFANRAQIEKTFFRAFTMLLTSNATFYQARLATIQSARDLYGIGGGVERAVSQAWDAVGVTSPGAALTTTFSPNPVPASSASCGGGRPSFTMTVSVREFQNVGFNVAGFEAFTYDTAGRLLASEAFSSSTFADWFTSCGAGSTRIPPGALACARLCNYLGGRTAGYSYFRFRGIDANGNPGTFLSDPIGLGVALGASDDPNAAFGPVTLTKVP